VGIRWADARYIPTGLGYVTASSRTLGAPMFFSIETLNHCNLRCVYCPQSKPHEHFINGHGRMTLEQFDAVLDRIQTAFRPRSVSLHRDGEPLLNPDLETYIAHATDRGMSVSFSTNGTLLTPERAQRLLSAGLRFANSDFCADAAVYESLRVGANWHKTLAGLVYLLDAADELKLPFRIIIKDLNAGGPETEQTRAAMSATRELFAKHAARVGVIPIFFHNALRRSAQDLSLRNPVRSSHYNLCHQPWVNMTIDWSGRVVGCCRDLRSEYVLGNILEQPAWEIWNGEPMRRLREALAQRRPRDINICASCDLPWRGSYSGRTLTEGVASYLFSRVYNT